MGAPFKVLTPSNGTFADQFVAGSEHVLLARMMDEHLPPAELPVSPDDFTPVNRLIHDAIRDIERIGDFPHFMRVTERLRATGNLRDVGGEHGDHKGREREHRCGRQNPNHSAEIGCLFKL
jgi:hypothetical protein